MTLNELSDSVYVINLKERTDRKKHIVNELKKINCINYTFIEAINGKKLKNTTKLTDGMFGLINTYINIYIDWKNENKEDIIIIEDDCVFVESFNEKLHNYVINVPKDWDMMYFGANHNYHIGEKTKTVNEKCIKLNNSYSAHCVLLKSHVFEELIFNLLNFETENDVMMANLQRKYNAYSSVPNLTSQIVTYSDIQNSIMDYNWLIK
jgi:GR25 family glycosyltransferase involved in LPS biosynthesis